VLLNITGGGRLLAGRRGSGVAAEPRLRLTRAELGRAETVDRVAAACPAAAPVGAAS
jgi:hypothetical protein